MCGEVVCTIVVEQASGIPCLERIQPVWRLCHPFLTPSGELPGKTRLAASRGPQCWLTGPGSKARRRHPRPQVESVEQRRRTKAPPRTSGPFCSGAARLGSSFRMGPKWITYRSDDWLAALSATKRSRPFCQLAETSADSRRRERPTLGMRGTRSTAARLRVAPRTFRFHRGRIQSPAGGLTVSHLRIAGPAVARIGTGLRLVQAEQSSARR